MIKIYDPVALLLCAASLGGLLKDRGLSFKPTFSGRNAMGGRFFVWKSKIFSSAMSSFGILR